MDVFAANEWHWWIAVVLTPGAVVTVLALIAGYFNKVVRLKYPPHTRKQG
jgi:hypothetical protein